MPSMLSQEQDYRLPSNGMVKDITAVDFFCGGGGISLALEHLGFRVVLAVDLSENAVENYNYNLKYPVAISASIRDLTADMLVEMTGGEEIHLVVGGPPCFVGDTPIITSEGYKPISNIKKGELVLTHSGKYKPVSEVMKRKYKGKLFSIKLKGRYERCVCTPEHPILVREYGKKWNKEKKSMLKTFIKEDFIPASEIKPDIHYLALPNVQEFQLPEIKGYYLDNNKEKVEFIVDLPYEDEDFWYLMGFYVAEGWYCKSGRKRKKSIDPEYRSHRYEVSFSINSEEKDKIKKMLEKFFNVYESNPGTCYRLTISSKDLWWFVKNFGKDAYHKCIPEFIYKLPKNFVKKFCDGLIDGDGCTYKETINLATISPYLNRDFYRLVAKAYNRNVRCFKEEKVGKSVILGREVNVHDLYHLSFNENVKSFINWKYDEKKEYIWVKVDEIKELSRETDVWNLEVDEDHTYCVPFVSHNCKSFSLSGKRNIMDPRASLVDEFYRAVEILKPRYFLMENVPGITSMLRPDKKTLVTRWIEKRVAKMGYGLKWKSLQAHHYGTPQARERIFFLGWKEGCKVPVFPPPSTHSNDASSSLFGRVLHNYTTVREAFESIPDNAPNQDLVYKFVKEDYIEKVKKLKGGESVYKHFSESHRRLWWDKPAFTIKQNHGSIAIHPEETRMINLREMASLQDFPHEYEFIGSNSDIAGLIGNAVPVLMARAIIKEIKKVIK